MHNSLLVKSDNPLNKLLENVTKPILIQLIVGPDVIQKVDAIDQVHREEPLVAIDL